VTIGGVRPVRGRVATLCDISPHQFVTIAPQGAVSHWWPDATERELVGHARRTAAVHRLAYCCCVASHWAGRSLVEDHGIDPRRVHVVGLGHSLHQGTSTSRDWSSPRFLFVGRDWRRKNGDAVVRAFVEVRRRQPLASLDVVGGHPRLAVDGVTGHGELDSENPDERAKLSRLYGRATCFVMPSLIEPFGIAYVEAAAAGIASIATCVGGTAESVGDGGVFVHPADVGAIADAMEEMCDPTRAASLGERARCHARLLTWDAVAQRILRALDLTVPGLELAEFL
jgi:glycosyltransferase involved in cell wall biosynthesis